MFEIYPKKKDLNLRICLRRGVSLRWSLLNHSESKIEFVGVGVGLKPNLLLEQKRSHKSHRFETGAQYRALTSAF